MKCTVCGGSMVGDGYVMTRHCENVDCPDDVEPDAPPVMCMDGKDGTTTDNETGLDAKG